MKEPIYDISNDDNDALFIKDIFFKYLKKWPWFLLSLLLFLIIAFLVIRYSPIIYATEAKIKVIDDSKDFDIAEDALSLLGGGSNVNLDNEIAVIKSYRLLEQVVSSLNLDVAYYEVGKIKTRRIFQSPVVVNKLFSADSINQTLIYEVELINGGIAITSPQDNTKTLKTNIVNFNDNNFPISIELNKDFKFSDQNSQTYRIVIKNKKRTVLELAKNLEVKQINSKSDVLSLKIENESSELSEAILNDLITKFNQDGILDRQLVSKNTLNFIDDRFIYLSQELDSIELDKQEYKQSNNLSYIQADAGVAIEKRSIVENEVFRIETQLELSKLLKKTLNTNNSFNLLPADIGVENANINSLIFEYNQLVLQNEKLIVSAGINNPAVQLIASQLKQLELNIINTVNAYQNQLKVSLKQLKIKENSAGARFAKLPEKEKTLRAIDRQQFIKENLFLLLLQKREEAAINFAVTAPSIKVVDYGVTSLDPIAPRKLIILGLFSFLGFAVPLGFFFTKFTFDTKVKTKSELEKIEKEIPILGEIPFLNNLNSFFDINERSVKAESFRILGSNVNYLLPQQKKEKGNVIYVTSAIKGEGKTSIAFNLSMALASLNHKVLLVGADLRNPQLHNYNKVDRNVNGISSFLHDQRINWKDCILKNDNINNFDICLSGPIPPNAPQLLVGNNFKSFLEEAKSEYDFVVLDTAPTLLVADTLLISKHADVTIFVIRSDFTDKRLLQFSKDLYKLKKLKNVAYVLNGVEFNKNTGYNYGYEYGYTSSVEE